MAAQKNDDPSSRKSLAEGSRRVDVAIREQQRLLVRVIRRLGQATVEDVHQGRVTARRLRSMLKTFGALLEPRRARLYRMDLRRLAHALTLAREADVRRKLLGDVGRSGGLATDELERLDALLDDLRVDARESLRRHLREPGWAALMKALERHVARSGAVVVRDASLADVLELAVAAWKRPVRLLERRPTSVTELHDLRLALKHCRYAMEPLADVAPEPGVRLAKALRAAQDSIGEHRDTLLADHWVRSNERSLGRPLVDRLTVELAARERRLRRKARRKSAALLPAWKAWRRATAPVRRAGSTGRP